MLSQIGFLNYAKTQQEREFFLEFCDTFRRANKIFNLSFAKHCPTISQTYFHMANEVHKARWEACDNIDVHEKFLHQILFVLKRSSEKLEDLEFKNSSNYQTLVAELKTQLQEQSNSIPCDVNNNLSTSSLLLDAIIKNLQSAPVCIDSKKLKLFLLEAIQTVDLERANFIKNKKAALECNVLQHKPFFYLYFWAEDRNDDDIIIDSGELAREEEIVLKKLKLLLNSSKYDIRLKIKILFPLFQGLLRKIHYPLNDQSITYEIPISLPHMAKWAELGLRFIEQLNQCGKLSRNKKEDAKLKKYMNSTSLRATLLNLKIMYSNLALCLITGSNYDLQWMYAETYLELSESIQIEAIHLVESNPHLAFTNPATRALLAYKRNHIDDFFIYLDQMIEQYKKYATKINHNQFPTYVDILMTLIGKAVLISLETSDVLHAFHYQKDIIYILNKFNEDILFTNNVQNKSYQCQRKELLKFYEILRTHLKNQLHNRLVECFAPFKKISVFTQDENFFIFLPLSIMPKRHELTLDSKYLKIEKVYKDEIIADQKITGLKLKVLSYAIDPIIKEIHNILAIIEKHTNSLPKQNVEAKIADIPAIGLLSLNNTSEPLEETSREKVVIQRKTQAYKANINKPSKPLTISNVTAAQFGFNIKDNPEVTPIYFSKQGQKLGKPTVFVRWQGIAKIDNKIALMFKKMLNPTMEGLVTVGLMNQAGAKIHNVPDALGDSWNLCGLRFKRKGHGAGWLRAIAVSEQKISVESKDGRMENRYLFALGKAKQK